MRYFAMICKELIMTALFKAKLQSRAVSQKGLAISTSIASIVVVTVSAVGITGAIIIVGVIGYSNTSSLAAPSVPLAPVVLWALLVLYPWLALWGPHPYGGRESGPRAL